MAGLSRSAVDYDTSATLGLIRDQAIALLGADIEDLGTDRGHRVLRVRRKGDRIQALALPAPATGRIDAYLADRDRTARLCVIRLSEPCRRSHPCSG